MWHFYGRQHFIPGSSAWEAFCCFCLTKRRTLVSVEEIRSETLSQQATPVLFLPRGGDWSLKPVLLFWWENYKTATTWQVDEAVSSRVSVRGQQFAQQIQQQNPELIEQLRNHIRSRSFSGSAEEHSWSAPGIFIYSNPTPADYRIS